MEESTEVENTLELAEKTWNRVNNAAAKVNLYFIA